MNNNKQKPGKFRHPTESNPQVLTYLESYFGSTPSTSENGADLVLTDGTTVEVKSTKEWHRSSYSNGRRRRGRFALHGYEKCDYFLFVLCREAGNLEMFILPYLKVLSKFRMPGTINWLDVAKIC